MPPTHEPGTSGAPAHAARDSPSFIHDPKQASRDAHYDSEETGETHAESPADLKLADPRTHSSDLLEKTPSDDRRSSQADAEKAEQASGTAVRTSSDSGEGFTAETAALHLESSIPDGGLRAWLVVVGSFCGILITFGVSNATGTIQDYLKSEVLQDKSDSDIGWIFSLWLFFMYLGGVQTGPVFDAYGLRPLLIPGCIGWCAACFILSVCKEYYQFILGFSVLGGISSSMIFNPCITVLGHWFFRKRALATGFATTGGAVGGIFLPLMMETLFPRLGYGWTIRVMAFIVLGLAIIACLTLESRHVKRKVDWREALIDVRSLRITKFFFCCFGVFLVEWAVFIPIILMVTYARAQGLSYGYSNAVLAYLNVGSVLGRSIPGYVADRLGTYNVMIVTSMVTGVLILALWIPGGSSKAGLTTFAVLFGFWSGSTISLTPVCVSSVSSTKDYGKRYGTAYSIASIAVLTGLPIGGELTDNNFLGTKIFSGVVYVAGAAAFSLSRWFAVGFQRYF